MNCLFLFKSKKPKPRNQQKDKRKGKEIAQNSAPELRNQSETSSFNLQTPRSLPSPRSIRDLYTEREKNLRVFTYQELSEATYGFNRKLKIGEGGFGSVYKGKIPTAKDSDSDSPLAVAIKKLNRQGLQVFSLFFALFLNVKSDTVAQRFDLLLLGSQAMASRGSVSRGSESSERCEALRLLLGRWGERDGEAFGL